MVEHSKVNVKFSNSQLNKLKTAVKNKKGVTFENEYQNISWKQFASWIIIDIKTKKLT